ncbi:MAG: ABC transporter ATP-binding protein [Nocardioidaceae bacterium]
MSPRAAEPGVAVTVRGLRKAYGGIPAVRDVSFEVGTGEIVGLLGPNGAGKTTTVECLQGLRRADAGELGVLGLDPWARVDSLRRRIGCQLQDASLPMHLRAGEAVRLFAAVGGRQVDVDAVLGEWGLTAKRRTAFGDLSGGQRQRLFVALALLHRPELVFLDEMTTGLDPAARHETWRLVERVRELGATIVLVTHFMDEAERLCDRLVVVRDGTVVATGSPTELVLRHGGGLTAVLTTAVPEERLRAVTGVHAVRRRGELTEIEGDPEALLHLGHLLVEQARVPTDLVVRQATLEDAYLRLVGGERSEPTS